MFFSYFYVRARRRQDATPKTRSTAESRLRDANSFGPQRLNFWTKPLRVDESRLTSGVLTSVRCGEFSLSYHFSHAVTRWRGDYHDGPQFWFISVRWTAILYGGDGGRPKRTSDYARTPITLKHRGQPPTATFRRGHFISPHRPRRSLCTNRFNRARSFSFFLTFLIPDEFYEHEGDRAHSSRPVRKPNRCQGKYFRRFERRRTNTTTTGRMFAAAAAVAKRRSIMADWSGYAIFGILEKRLVWFPVSNRKQFFNVKHSFYLSPVRFRVDFVLVNREHGVVQI